MKERDHAFDPATDAGVCVGKDAEEAGFFAAGSASFAEGFRMRRVGVILRASGVFKNSWKSRSLPKAMLQCFLDYIVSRSLDESGILIDLICG